MAQRGSIEAGGVQFVKDLPPLRGGSGGGRGGGGIDGKGWSIDRKTDERLQRETEQRLERQIKERQEKREREGKK